MVDLIIISVAVLIFVTAGWFLMLGQNNAKKKLKPDTEGFLCNIQLANEPGQDTENRDFFSISMKGTVYSPEPGHDTDVQIIIHDITDGFKKIRPVLTDVIDYQKDNSKIFLYRQHNGALPRKECHLSDWINILNIPVKKLKLASSGKRKLAFVVSILSKSSKQQLARATKIFEYNNPDSGYMQTKNQYLNALTLGTKICQLCLSENSQISKKQICILDKWKKWKLNQIEDKNKLNNKIKKNLRKLKKYKNTDDIITICNEKAAEINEAEKLETIELVSTILAESENPNESIALVKKIAEGIKINNHYLSDMIQKYFPVDNCLDSLEAVLGIENEMTAEQIAALLSEKYRIWNSRITHQDSKIAKKAENMLQLIAQARHKYLPRTTNSV